ncbi:MAG: metalloregulator ArsR/SmtB family transcription factor [Deltaproteobacteria bacterium]|nr:metalloregulator ArsR/SmtB family transcription factor [Deltaproteobacteria bacterium]
MKKTAQIFQALSDETRLRVMKLLQERELCVCELIQVLEMSQPRISRHLSVLKNAGLVNDRREGKWVYYSLKKGAENDDVKPILETISLVANDDSVVRNDNKNLKKAVRLSEIEGCCSSRKRG